jgi:hypothetical protein
MLESVMGTVVETVRIGEPPLSLSLVLPVVPEIVRDVALETGKAEVSSTRLPLIAPLTRILSVLKEYDVPATFFVNGEFVRRYPSETKQVAASGYECASLFFTNADLTGKGFVVDADFIRRGLARNEDEFYAATGKELSLFWHAPFYRVSADMKKAANASGYRYVDCGKWSLDTQTFEEALRRNEHYLTASEIISYYAANAHDMTIIPVITGISKGSRSDYLYDKLDLLITALWDAGYEIVPIRLFI